MVFSEHKRIRTLLLVCNKLRTNQHWLNQVTWPAQSSHRKTWILLESKAKVSKLYKKNMSYHLVKLCLISLLAAFVAQPCSCYSAIQTKQKPVQRTHLALPAVTCSARGIRAVFDPLVKNNVRARSKICFFCCYLFPAIWIGGKWIIPKC